jgi:CelD/BcsL family acetyltransferase involved in cellulose biosynthesis
VGYTRTGYSVAREELASLEGPWRDILPSSGPKAVFYSPLWLKTWWAEFADGRELMLLSVRDGQRLVGIAPLMREGERLTLAGDTNVCDYMDIVACEGCEEGVLDAVLDAVSEEAWSELVLWGVPEYSPTLTILPRLAAGLGYSAEVEQEDVCPRVELPATFDDYVEGLDRRDRHELRRKLRRLYRSGHVLFHRSQSAAEVESHLDDFLRQHAASRHEKALFMTERMARFFRRMVLTLAEQNLVQLYCLEVNGVRAASVLCFDAGDELLLYNSGYDPDYASLAVGLLSKSLALEQAIEDGKRRFDFLRGAEPYKYDLGGKDLAVYRCMVRREGR